MTRVTRYAFGIEYDGSDFMGWQRQPQEGRTVQAAVEEALTKVADHPVEITCAGRTDAGVHAAGQVIHFDTEARRDLRGWLLGTNSTCRGTSAPSGCRRCRRRSTHASRPPRASTAT